MAATLLTAVVYTLLLREAAGLPATVTGFFLMPVALIIRWAVDLLIWGDDHLLLLKFHPRPDVARLPSLGNAD